MSATNRGGKRRTDDNYATPAWAVHAILPHLRLWDGYNVLDPCAGDGHLLDAVLTYAEHVADVGIEAHGIEINGRRAKKLGFEHRDALTGGKWLTPKPNLIITNPPYSLAMPFLCRAFTEVAKDGEVAFLLRLNWLASKGRAEFHKANPCDVYVLSKRPQFCKNKDGKMGSDATEYCWMVFGRDRGAIGTGNRHDRRVHRLFILNESNEAEVHT